MFIPRFCFYLVQDWSKATISGVNILPSLTSVIKMHQTQALPSWLAANNQDRES